MTGGKKAQKQAKKDSVNKPKRVSLQVKVSTSKKPRKRIQKTEIQDKQLIDIRGNKKINKREMVLKAISGRISKKKIKSEKIELIGDEPKIKIAKTRKKKVLQKTLKTAEDTEKKARSENKGGKTSVLKQVKDLERIEREKRLMMKAGVTFFMVLIVFVWMYNTKQFFQKTALENKNPSTDWEEMTDEISYKILEMKEGLDEIKNFDNSTSTDELQATGTQAILPDNDLINKEDILNTTSTDLKIEEEEINELKKKLEEKIGDNANAAN